MRTTVDIPDPVGKAAKDVARREGTTLRALIVEGLRWAVERRRARPATYRLEDCSYGQGGLVEGLAPGDWDSLRDRSYEGRGA